MRRARISEQGIPRGVWPGAPDLAGEVVSPGETYAEVEEEVHDWLNAGTRMVLMLNPRTHTVAVHTSHASVMKLTELDTLNGGEVLPGLTRRGSQNDSPEQREGCFFVGHGWGRNLSEGCAT